ncbi:MAG: hypothetical protein HY736_15710, partial [Verrucomicrobia bacterium]|nr:hypothetical protein [Verrucomicrobiota bacterium]
MPPLRKYLNLNRIEFDQDISGGMCPFLKESCRQFDPSKVQSDLDAQAAVILVLEQKVTETASLHVAAKKSLQGLEASETRLGAKRVQQGRDIVKYVADFNSAVPTDVILAYDRLIVWEPKLAAAARIPAVPSAPVQSGQVVLLQTNLEQFKSTTDARWKDAVTEIAIRLKISDQDKTARQADQSSLDHFSFQATALQKETASLLKNAEAKTGEAKRLD